MSDSVVPGNNENASHLLEVTAGVGAADVAADGHVAVAATLLAGARPP